MLCADPKCLLRCVGIFNFFRFPFPSSLGSPWCVVDASALQAYDTIINTWVKQAHTGAEHGMLPSSWLSSQITRQLRHYQSAANRKLRPDQRESQLRSRASRLCLVPGDGSWQGKSIETCNMPVALQYGYAFQKSGPNTIHAETAQGLLEKIKIKRKLIGISQLIVPKK